MQRPKARDRKNIQDAFYEHHLYKRANNNRNVQNQLPSFEHSYL